MRARAWTHTFCCVRNEKRISDKNNTKPRKDNIRQRDNGNRWKNIATAGWTSLILAGERASAHASIAIVTWWLSWKVIVCSLTIIAINAACLWIVYVWFNWHRKWPINWPIHGLHEPWLVCKRSRTLSVCLSIWVCACSANVARKPFLMHETDTGRTSERAHNREWAEVYAILVPLSMTDITTHSIFTLCPHRVALFLANSDFIWCQEHWFNKTKE